VLSVFASVAIAVLWVSAPRVEGGRGQAQVVEGETPTVTDAAPPRLPTIAEENLKPGDVTWPAPNDPTVWDKVRGFTDRVSAQRGDSERRLEIATVEREIAEIERRNAAKLRSQGSEPMNLEHLPSLPGTEPPAEE
jgi:hypothetical protein